MIEFGDDAATSAPDLIVEDAQVAGPAAPDGASSDDPEAPPVYLVLLSASAAGS